MSTKAVSRTIEATQDIMSARARPLASYPISAVDLRAWDHCPICLSIDLSTLSIVYLDRALLFFETAMCRSCGLVFRRVFPDNAWFSRCWEAIVDSEPKIVNAGLEQHRQSRYREYLARIRRHCAQGAVLDIGAAFGAGSQVFADAGYRVTAVEPEDTRAWFIEQNRDFPCYHGFIEDFAERGGDFDAIVMAHSLEHTADAEAALHAVLSLLRPHGIVYLEVPDIWEYADWLDAFYLPHRYNFDSHTLRRLVEKVGFTVLDSFPVHEPGVDGTHLGMLLSATRPASTVTELAKSDAATLHRLERIYRGNLPPGITPPESGPLLYTVPAITQFFHTIRLSETRFEPWSPKDGFIECRPVTP